MEGKCAEALLERDFAAFRRAEDALFASLLTLHPNAELTRLVADLRARTPLDGLRAGVECGVVAASLLPHQRLLDLIETGEYDAVECLVDFALGALRYVGAPVMDAPHLSGAPMDPGERPDGEFLDAALD